jgi:hypothetical protein
MSDAILENAPNTFLTDPRTHLLWIAYAFSGIYSACKRLVGWSIISVSATDHDLQAMTSTAPGEQLQRLHLRKEYWFAPHHLEWRLPHHNNTQVYPTVQICRRPH